MKEKSIKKSAASAKRKQADPSKSESFVGQSIEVKKSKKTEYFEAVGRRKRAVARVRLFTVSPSDSMEMGNLVINDKNYKDYFPTQILQQTVESPFIKLKSTSKFNGTIKVNGGGISGQAEAVRHGISRALIIFDINCRKKLKKAGFLKRDPREKERRKFGLKKARKAPQWSKR
jgi:small subunit ribosomal protein S9